MKNKKSNITDSFDEKIKKSFETISKKTPAFNFDVLDSIADDTIFEKITTSFENKKVSAPAFNFDELNKSSEIAHADKIIASFETINTKAPNFNFDKLGDLSEKNHFNKIKNSFNDRLVITPVNIWTNIEKTLNLERVWQNIIPNLTPNQFIGRRILTSALVTIILLLIPFSFSDSLIKNSKFNNAKFQIITAHHLSESVLTNSNNPKRNNLFVQKIKNSETYLQTNTNENKKQFAVIADETNTLVIENHINENIISPQKRNESFKTNQTTMAFTQPKFVIQSKQVYPKSLEVGIIGGINYTRINNNDVRASKRKSSLYSSQMSFGEFYGVTANYNLNSNYALSSEFMFNSKSTQKNSQFSGGHLNKSITEINYYKLSVLINRKIRRFATQKSDFKIGIGPYVALNKNSISSVNDKVNTINSGFKQFDLGFKTKLFYERSISNFVITYGLSTETGVLNINNGNSYVPSYLNVTSIFNIGGFVEIRYKL